MRHIPEAELHAYLDQALSRSQCVEIERHLAACPPCQGTRDHIAALRDRTTALLARIGPPTIVPAAFATLALRHAERTRHRRQRVANLAWAASIVGAALLGWGLNRVPARTPTLAVAAGDVPTDTAPSTAFPIPAAIPSAPTPSTATSPPPAPRSSAARGDRAPTLVRIAPKGQGAATSWFASTVETDPGSLYSARRLDPVSVGSISQDVPDFSAQPVAIAPALAGLWRNVVPDSVPGLRNSDIPLVPGLAVVQMRVQPGYGESDITAVDQALDSGELIRTIAGPAGRVGRLVEQNTELDPEANAAGARVTVTIRQGDRMVAVTGPSEALGSLLSRVNARRRY